MVAVGAYREGLGDLGGLEEKNLPTTSLFVHSTVSGTLAEGLSQTRDERHRKSGSSGPFSQCTFSYHLPVMGTIGEADEIWRQLLPSQGRCEELQHPP